MPAARVRAMAAARAMGLALLAALAVAAMPAAAQQRDPLREIGPTVADAARWAAERLAGT